MNAQREQHLFEGTVRIIDAARPNRMSELNTQVEENYYEHEQQAPT